MTVKTHRHTGLNNLITVHASEEYHINSQPATTCSPAHAVETAYMSFYTFTRIDIMPHTADSYTLRPVSLPTDGGGSQQVRELD